MAYTAVLYVGIKKEKESISAKMILHKIFVCFNRYPSFASTEFNTGFIIVLRPKYCQDKRICLQRKNEENIKFYWQKGRCILYWNALAPGSFLCITVDFEECRNNMRRTSIFKSVFAFVMMIILVLGSTISFRATSRTYDNGERPYEIAVAYDNSGSMYNNANWCYAKYAM